MKKLFAFLLAALTAASVTATAFAQEAAPSATLQVGSADGLTLDGSALLHPGQEYRFPLMIAENGEEARPMTVEDMQVYDIKVTAKSGRRRHGRCRAPGIRPSAVSLPDPRRNFHRFAPGCQIHGLSFFQKQLRCSFSGYRPVESRLPFCG